LQSIGDRLVAHLPPSKLKYTFRLVESQMVNAFTLPGGRIYVTRKLVVTSHSEDEIAGVLAHELGHNALHHGSATMTKLLEVVLGVNHLGDRKDVEDKLHQLADNIARKSGKVGKIYNDDREDEQRQSDLLGIYIATRAGYRPTAEAEFWNRTFEVEGKTGNAFTDFFRITKPDQKRLRGMLQMPKQLPPACLQIPPVRTSGFAAWQKSVLENDRGVQVVAAAAPDRKVLNLQKPIRSDVDVLRYSPDGKFMLVQDEFGISILDRQPMKMLFRVDAEDALPARFSPDSHSIVFSNDQLRVERWSVADKKREFAREVWMGGCLQSQVSPDGEYLACIRYDLRFRVSATKDGRIVFDDKDQPDISFADYLNWIFFGLDRIAHSRFSEDSRYVLYRIGLKQVGVDLSTGKRMGLSGGVEKVSGYSFEFQGTDRLFGINRFNPSDSAVVSFPSGKTLFKMKLLRQNLAAPTHGDFAIVHPIKDYATGIFSLKDQKFVMGVKGSAFDIYDDEFINERKTGQIGRYRLLLPKPELIEATDIPAGDLTRAQFFTLSPDRKYIALSTRSRGAVWDLTTGERMIFMRGFDGGQFVDSDFVATLTVDADETQGQAEMDTSKKKDKSKDEDEELKRKVRILVHLNVPKKEVLESRELDDKRSILVGTHLLTFAADKKRGDDDRTTHLQVFPLGSDKALWDRYLTSRPPDLHWNTRENLLILKWHLDSEGAKQQIKEDPKLQAAAKAMKEKEGDYLFELLDLPTGKRVASLFMETGKGSFHVNDISATRKIVAAAVNDNRVLVYDVNTGQVLARLFGDAPVVLSDAGLLAIRKDRNVLSLYDLATFQPKGEHSFAHPVIGASLTADRKHMLVVLGDQSVVELPLETSQVAQNVH
jgi:WD40 repeat protein